jgi:hypothetical protein
VDQPFTLADVVTKSELARRPSRGPNYQAENDALNALGDTLAHSPHTVLQKLVEVALELCRPTEASHFAATPT